MKLHPPSMRHRRAITDGTMDELFAAEQSERTALKAFGKKFSKRRIK
jgi:hypothetical protein